MDSNHQVFSVFPGKSGHQTLHIPLWGPYDSLPLCPFILGGHKHDLPRPLNLSDAHYHQTDTTLNKHLWAEHPWNLTNFVKTHSLDRLKQLATKLTTQLQSDPSQSKTVDIPHERLRIANNIATLELMMDTLSVHGFLDGPPTAGAEKVSIQWNKNLEESMANIVGPKPLLPQGYNSDWIHPRVRKQNTIVEPVRTVVKRVKAKKKIITTTGARVHQTAPRTSPLDGVAFVLHEQWGLPVWSCPAVRHLGGTLLIAGESDLWVLLGISALRCGRLTDHYLWFTGANDCFDAILNMRYTTFSAMSRACFIAHETRAALYRHNPVPLGGGASIFEHEAVQSISNYIMGHAFRLMDKTDGAWAHQYCIERHVCNRRQNDGYFIMYSKWGGDAIQLRDGLGGEPTVKVDPAVNDYY